MRTGWGGTAVGSYQSLPWGDEARVGGTDSDGLHFSLAGATTP